MLTLLFLGLVAGQNEVSGRWSILGSNRVTCIHTFLVPNSKIICMERPHVAPYPLNQESGGDVVTQTTLNPFQVITIPATRNPFCSGHAQTPDGNVLVIGGDYPTAANVNGQQILVSGMQARRTLVPCADGDTQCTTASFNFDPVDMSTARWYPTVTTLKDGNFIIVSGSLKNLDFQNLSDTNNPTYEYYPSKQGTWPRKLDALDWAFPFNLYPMVFQLTTGKVMLFVANRTVLIDDNDNLDTSIPDILIPDKRPWIYPSTPTSTMMPLTLKNKYTSKIMVCGGTRLDNNADNRCITIDFADAKPEWKQNTQMLKGRLMPDSIILPDGKIIYLNGASYGLSGGDAGDSRNANDPVYDVDLYDPETNTWTALAPMTVARLYHSGVILLPDGRIVTSGSEEQNYMDVKQNRTDCFPFDRTKACTSPFEYRMEVYEPYYLFKTVERPVIASAPKKATYGSTIGVSTSTDASLVDKVSFIRYSTSTHSTNMDQRFVELAIVSANSSYLVLQLPDSGAVAPAGNWMLFLMREGKPSVAVTVNLNTGDKTQAADPLNPIKLKSSASRITCLVSLALFALFLL